jgi:hypothetical protein
MAATLRRIVSTIGPLWLDCGHSTLANGYPAPEAHAPPQVDDPWWCEGCALPFEAQLDQELEAAREWARQRAAESESQEDPR